MNKENIDILVKKYPKLFPWSRGYPSCHDGWFWIIDNVCLLLERYQHSTKQIVFVQIKEKFGCLRMYYDGDNEYVRGIIAFAEQLSSLTCEYCGTMKNIGKTNGWIKTCCKKCFKENHKNKDDTTSWTKL